MDNQQPIEPLPPITPVSPTPSDKVPSVFTPQRHSPLIPIIFVVVIVALIGGTVFAYTKGYISLPFLSNSKANTNTTANINVSTNMAGNTSISTELSAMPAPLDSWNEKIFNDITYGSNSNNGNLGYVLHPALQPHPVTVAAGQASCAAVAPKEALDLGKNYCFENLAAGFRAANICEQLSDKAVDLSGSDLKSDVTQCYVFFAKIYAPFDCASVTRQPNRDLCYAAFAVDEKQPTLNCNPIQDDTIKTSCLESVSNKRDSIEFENVMEQVKYAYCYIHVHPDVLQAMPKNEISSSYTDYVTATGDECEKLDAKKIETAKALVVTDQDQDGLTLMSEMFFGTSDTKADSDGNGVSDLDEILKLGDNPLDKVDYNKDSDGDNLADELETTLHHTNPNEADTDSDGLSDYEEVSGYYTDPVKTDTDGDNHDDGTEVCHSYNPLGNGGYSSGLLYPPASCPPNLTPVGNTRPGPKNKTTMTIDGLQATATVGKATVTWTTKEGAYAAVYFGTTSAYDSGRYPDSLGYLTSHTVSFPVTSGTTYHYAVLSCPKTIFYLSECALSADQTVVGK